MFGLHLLTKFDYFLSSVLGLWSGGDFFTRLPYQRMWTGNFELIWFKRHERPHTLKGTSLNLRVKFTVLKINKLFNQLYKLSFDHLKYLSLFNGFNCYLISVKIRLLDRLHAGKDLSTVPPSQLSKKPRKNWFLLFIQVSKIAQFKAQLN